MRRRPLPLIAVSMLLAGCSVGPDYQRPDTPTPAAWNETNSAQGIIAQDWWKQFHQPQLDHLMDLALAGNFDLAAAAARVRQADAQLDIASSSLFPTISLGAGANRVYQQNSASGKSVHYNTYNVQAGASYELDFWGKNRDARDVGQANANARRFDQQTITLTVQSAVANTYFSILALQDRIKAAQSSLDSAQGILDAYHARAQVGLASQLDVSQQETLAAQQQAALPPLRLQLRQNIYALATLTGTLPESLQLDPSALDTSALPVVPAGLPSQLLTRRPDVAYAEMQLVAANASLKQTIASVYPSLSLTAAGGGQSNSLDNLFSPTGLLFSLGASLAQPIFKGGALQGGIDLARAQGEELTANYQKAVINAFQDTEGALSAVQQTAEQDIAQQKAAAAAASAAAIAQAQLKTGTIDLQTLLNTQRTLAQAQDAQAQAKLSHAQAVVGLFRALGGGWEMSRPTEGG